MGRLMAGLVAACVVMSGASSTLAQQASDFPGRSGGLVAVADLGFALTVPGDWTVLVDSDAATDVWLASAEEVAGGQLVETYQAMLANGVTLGMYAKAPTVEADEVADCTVTITPNPSGLDVEEILALNTASIRAHPAIVGEPSSSPIDLPAGPAGKMSHALQFDDPGATGREITVVTYIFPALGRVYALGCSGFGSSDDDWLSIAETFEFLPNDQPPPGPPVGVGGRIAIPGADFALTFPDDWPWVRYAGWDWEAVRFELAELVGDDEADGFEAFYPDLDDDSPLIGQGPDGLCRVHITPSALPLDEFVPGYLANRESGGLHYGVTRSDVALRSGEATRLVYDLVADSPSHGWVGTDYLWSTGSAIYLLMCMSPEHPSDDWLSIAETLEFLPIQE